MAIINFKEIKKQLSKQSPKQITNAADKVLDRRFIKYRNKFLEEVAEDKISQEISAGAYASNGISNLLPKGNLYSFLGFEAGATPIVELINYLSATIEKNPSKVIKGKKNITVRSSVSYPSLEELENANDVGGPAFITNDSKYPNRGWIHAVRKGQSGYGRYVYETVRELGKSRSGTGLQISGTRNFGKFQPSRQYLSKQLTKFIKNIRKK